MDLVLGEDSRLAHLRMQAGLLRSVFGLMALVGVGLLIRELTIGALAFTPLFSGIVGVGVWLWSRRPTAPLRGLGRLLCLSIVFSITNAALQIDGAASSVLCLSFMPGLLAMLVLGSGWGFFVSGLMLCAMAWLGAVTDLPILYDRLRFQDEIALTILAAGLGYALRRSLVAYEETIAQRRSTLLRARQKRQAMTATVYEVLEPLSARLVSALSRESSAWNPAQLDDVLGSLLAQLGASRALSQSDGVVYPVLQDHDFLIRRKIMRVWLRIGALFLLAVTFRNFVAGVSFAPSLMTLVTCGLFDFWLARTSSAERMELMALVVGLLASAPLIAYIYQYGGTLDAPALVVMPSVVLFTALLSHGPASWAIVAIQVGTLVWVSVGSTMSLSQTRLFGDLTVGFLVVLVVLQKVFALRRQFAHTLRLQDLSLVESQRRHRRLSGTLFHDVRNHLQALILQLECEDDPELEARARSLSLRMQALISVSKDMLMNPLRDAPPTLQRVELKRVVELLFEVYGARLGAKSQHLSWGAGLDLQVMALPELLVDSVLGNLLSNAIKFSPSGSTIEIYAEKSGEMVKIVVGDSGAGLPSSVAEQLGHEGAVSSQRGTEGERGQGFGLQLVQEHLQRMAGRLEFMARPGGGTNAAVWLVEPGEDHL